MSSNGPPPSFSVVSSTNAIAVVGHTNSPFCKLLVVQAAPSNTPGAFLPPFRGGSVMVTNVGEFTLMMFPEYALHTVSVSRY